MPDQRTVFSTLRDVSAAIESIGEHRPPGMIVVGWTVLCLWKQGDGSVLGDHSGEDGGEMRARAWLEGKVWRVEEGLPVPNPWINLS